jgi:hypothetical protein
MALREHRSLSAYGGRGRSNGYLGTGAVVVEDPIVAAKQWRASLGVGASVSPKSRGAWKTYADRLQLLPADVEKGWEYLMNQEASEALVVFRAMMAEATSWWGRSVPYIFQVKQQASGEGFEFSKDGEVVWKEIQRSLPKDPKVPAKDVMQKAAEAVGMSLKDLPASDLDILELAVTWLQTGKATDMTPAGIPPRIGGAPGGPFRTTDGSHTLGTRGAP